MKQNQSTQRAAHKVVASLVPAHLDPSKPFAYVISRTHDENPFKGAPGRIAFLAESADFVRGVLAAMKELDYETGFAVFVSGRSFEIVGRMPVL
jgi:hypothetical protein